MPFFQSLKNTLSCCTDKKDIDPNNVVILHTWKVRPAAKGKTVESHSSLEIPSRDLYISLGFVPARLQEPGAPSSHFLGRQAKWNTKNGDAISLSGFENSEKYEYSCTKLYSLNIEGIVKAYHVFRPPALQNIEIHDSDKLKWAYVPCKETKQNCCSFCFYLLKAGDIDAVIPFFRHPKTWCRANMVFAITGAAIGFLIGLGIDYSSDEKVDEPEVDIGGALLGAAVGLLVESIFCCTGYIVCCSTKGVLHITTPRNLQLLVNKAVEGEKRQYNRLEETEGLQIPAVNTV